MARRRKPKPTPKHTPKRRGRRLRGGLTYFLTSPGGVVRPGLGPQPVPGVHHPQGPGAEVTRPGPSDQAQLLAEAARYLASGDEQLREWATVLEQPADRCTLAQNLQGIIAGMREVAADYRRLADKLEADWTEEDQKKADGEGWWFGDGWETEPELEATNLAGGDAEAVLLVYTRAEQGSRLHQRAVAYLNARNPEHHSANSVYYLKQKDRLLDVKRSCKAEGIESADLRDLARLLRYQETA